MQYVEEARGHETPCWIWQLSFTRKGRPKTAVRRRACDAHKVYYERANGPVPPGLVLDHLCRVPACVNPDHLEPVTPAENVRRGDLAKLTVEDVQAIRAWAAAGGRGQRALGERYGVTQRAISKIVRNENWRDV